MTQDLKLDEKREFDEGDLGLPGAGAGGGGCWKGSPCGAPSSFRVLGFSEV